MRNHGFTPVNNRRSVFSGDQHMKENIESEIQYLINDRIKAHKITGVINCFGINHLSWIGTTPSDDYKIMMVNTMGPYWVINYLVKLGVVARCLNISSVTHRVPQRCTTIYCASKAALSHMTKVMARELAPNGWVVNCFAPGKILGTHMTELVDRQVRELRGWSPEDADEYATKLVPAGRFLSQTEAAKIALQIFTMESYVNGETITAAGAS